MKPARLRTEASAPGPHPPYTAAIATATLKAGAASGTTQWRRAWVASTMATGRDQRDQIASGGWRLTMLRAGLAPMDTFRVGDRADGTFILSHYHHLGKAVSAVGPLAY
jgi:hypothetical protein